MTSAEALDAIDWPALARGMAGELILAGDPRMVLAGKHFAARLPFAPPRALLRCRGVEDIRRALAFAAGHDAPFAVRSGGHCFGDLSSSPGLVIDLAEMNDVAVERGHVRCGPGAASGDLSRALAERGRVVPTGGCPLVAIGGLALAGGFGFLGRRYGLVADQVERMEVVLADGRVVTASAQDEADLFWALRGGGGAGFGIVTELVLRTHPLEPLTLCNGRWPLAEAPALIEAWQHWAPDAPRAVNLEIGLAGRDLPEEPCVVELFGIILGTPAETAPHLAGLESRLGRLAAGLRRWELPPDAAADFLVGLLDRGAGPAWLPSRPYVATGFHATRSQFFERPVGREAIEALVARFAEDRRYAQHRDLELIPWRGTYADDDGTACFAHRGARWLIRHSAFAGARSDAALRAHAAAWADASAATLAGAANGHAYQGYAEPERADWARACYGEAAPRLAEIRARYDPQGLFAAAGR
ncbi:MAG TPA: FAD-binding oxidoreductase [Allosphingosinicella sp.]|nr:FAD-binding oxidoreductase [Allosphingosinicella sp.]